MARTVRAEDWSFSSRLGISVICDGRALLAQSPPKMAVPRKVGIREFALCPFIDRQFRPDNMFRVSPQAHTTLSRYKKITAETIREVVEMGRPGPNQLNSDSRFSMGPCQGRLGDGIVSEMIVGSRSNPPRVPGTIGPFPH